VFGVRKDASLSAALKDAGIRRAESVAVFQGERHWKSHPESRPLRSDGEKISKEEWYAGVCPNQRWLRDAVLSKVRKLARDERVDAVWLDFIRYPVHWEVPRPKVESTCFCPVCTGAFEDHIGVFAPGHTRSVSAKADWIVHSHGKAWRLWRQDRITGFVREVRKVLDEVRPGIILGLFVLPPGVDEGGKAIVRTSGQDLDALAKEADVLSPMLYHSMMARPTEWISESIREAPRSGRLLPIIALGDRKALDQTEVREAARRASAGRAEGVILFPQRHLVPASLKSLFFLGPDQPKR